MDKKTIILNVGIKIPMTYDNPQGYFKPHLATIGDYLKLWILNNDYLTFKFYDYLANDNFEGLVKFVCYHHDIISSISTSRISRFLTINLGCIMLLCDNNSVKKRLFNDVKYFVGKLNQINISDQELIDLINIDFDGCQIE